METTQALKDKIIAACKASGACKGQFDKLVAAETDAEFWDVIFRNYSWCVQNAVFAEGDYLDAFGHHATWVYLRRCTGLKSVPAFPNATWVDLGGCTGLKSVPAFPAARLVNLRSCTGLKSVPAFPNATWVDLGGCTGLESVAQQPEGCTVYR